MKLSSIQKEIIKLGGTVEVRTEPSVHGVHTEIIGELNGYDVHAFGNGGDSVETSYFTIRKISKRGTYDMGSDYNPGGYTFINRIKSLGLYVA